MIPSILLIAICNVIAGRWKDVFGIPAEKDVKGGRQITLFFRCVPIAIAATYYGGWYAGAVTLVGTLLWAAPGWSFDEITGHFDSGKYPPLIRKIGLWVVPVSGTGEEPSIVSAKNKLRGVIMKGLRGAYAFPLFIALIPLNPFAVLHGFGCLSMGACYWVGGFFGKYAVMIGEFIYMLIFAALVISAIQ